MNLEAKKSPSNSTETKETKATNVNIDDDSRAHRDFRRQRKNLVPFWVTDNLKNTRSWKTMFRCWLGCWLAFVVILPNKSLQTMGTTAFFALLTSLFIPPYLPVQMLIIVMSTVMLGVCLGWGLGIAAMRAANAVRNPLLLQAATAQLQASILASPARQANPSFAKSDAIFHGAFLDVRSSAMYGGFLAASAFIFALMRAYSPGLLLMSIYGTIAIDIFCSIGPLFPTARYTLLNSTAISIACYMGIAIIVTILVFPESMNHLMMNLMSKQLGQINAFVEMLDEVMEPGKSGNKEHLRELATRLREERKIIVESQRQITAFSGPLHLEFSWGKWSSKDVHALEEPLLSIVTYASGFQSFARLVAEPKQALPTATRPNADDANKPDQQEDKATLSDTLSLLEGSTLSLRRAITAGLADSRSILDIVNQRRWHWNANLPTSCIDTLDKAIDELSRELTSFTDVGRLELIAPYIVPSASNASAGTQQKGVPPQLRSLYMAHAFSANLVVLAKGVLAFMVLVRGTAERRPRNRLWAPTGSRTLGKVLRGKRPDPPAAVDTPGDGSSLVPAQSEGDGNVEVGLGLGGENNPPPLNADKDESNWRRDPDSKPPTNAIQRFFNGLHIVWNWMGTAEAKFTFKYVFISIALWIPSVIRHSAHFYYTEKGLWALIMAQTTLNIYASDQIFNLATRLLGTLIGLALGLAGWYIGNGRGNGNAYGAAASVAVIIVPLVFVRIFAPQKYLAGIVLCVATFALIVGYSWVDGHTVQYATPGIGWSVAWRRWVLVVIGAAASSVMMMLPPTSGRKAVRVRNAISLMSLSHLYGFLISTWIADATADSSDDTSSLSRLPSGIANTSPKWARKFRTRIIGVVEDTQNIRDLTELAKWEGSLRGAWPSDEYFRIVDLQLDMISSLAQIGACLSRLDNEWRIELLHNTKVLNPHFISDVMSMFALISHSLRTAEPMHQVLPDTLLDRLFYHPGSATTVNTLDADHLRSVNHMYYSSGLIGVYQLLQSLDEMHLLTKKLCGEVPLKGFTDWKDDYERARMVSELPETV